MQRRRLGPLEVSAIGLGAPVYGGATAADVAATIHRAIDLGIDLIDSSDAYDAGEHESFVGQALKGRRDTVVLTTKFGNMRTSAQHPAGADGRPSHVFTACEASLRRLAADTIDLYYIHRVDPAVPIEDTVGAMARLVQQGKVRHLGICEAAPSTLRRAHATHRIAALQTEYSLWTREPEQELLDTCAELGIGYVAYSPLGRGFLTGTIAPDATFAAQDRRGGHPRFQPDNLRHNQALVAAVKKIATEAGCTPAQLCVAWLLAQRDFIVPLPGTRRVRHVEENAAAGSLRPSPATLAALDRAFPPGAAHGARYPDAMLRLVGI